MSQPASIMVMTSRGEHYSARDQVPRAGTFDPATLILEANAKRINQKEMVDLIIRKGSLAQYICAKIAPVNPRGF
ncbi:hypothetical protein D3P08_14635 [Paenibacillus nanensis]|uniref:Uncharacterized protein n=1 Tax=Paenibacillus nanensis TaxID=393251 RepID=A0A3A1UXP1_9BACL|nr:hypothetical protein D3P08_14635 [Paenibacillus nanensis]